MRLNYQNIKTLDRAEEYSGADRSPFSMCTRHYDDGVTKILIKLDICFSLLRIAYIICEQDSIAFNGIF